MEQSITARLGCVQGQIHVARARLKASHEQAQVELAAAQAELVAVLNQVSPSKDLGVKATRVMVREKQNRGGLGPSQVAKSTDKLQGKGVRPLHDGAGKPQQDQATPVEGPLWDQLQAPQEQLEVWGMAGGEAKPPWAPKTKKIGWKTRKLGWKTS